MTTVKEPPAEHGDCEVATIWSPWPLHMSMVSISRHAPVRLVIVSCDATWRRHMPSAGCSVRAAREERVRLRVGRLCEATARGESAACTNSRLQSHKTQIQSWLLFLGVYTSTRERRYIMRTCWLRMRRDGAVRGQGESAAPTGSLGLAVYDIMRISAALHACATSRRT